jgi:hypothetical protein
VTRLQAVERERLADQQCTNLNLLTPSSSRFVARRAWRADRRDSDQKSIFLMRLLSTRETVLSNAEKLDLRSPVQDYFSPLFSTGWTMTQLDSTNESPSANDG